MSNPYVDHSALIAPRAREEAQRDGAPYIESQHLLLGIIEPRGIGGASVVLHRLGLSEGKVRAALELRELCKL